MEADMANMLYKILTPEEWQDARHALQFDGSAVDLADGFIHFSTARQAAETARRHFGGCERIHVLAVEPKLLPKSSLKWEPSRGGDLFPHLYAPLIMATVSKRWTIDRDPHGGFDFRPIFGPDMGPGGGENTND